MPSLHHRARAALVLVLTPLSLVAQGPGPQRVGLARIAPARADLRAVDDAALRARADSGATWSTEVGLGLGIVGGVAALIWADGLAGASETGGRNNALPTALFAGAVLGATGALIGWFFPKK